MRAKTMNFAVKTIALASHIGGDVMGENDCPDSSDEKNCGI